MLRFSEEIILLLLRDEDGHFERVPTWSINYALAGGVLMDLALENRIDTDPDHLVLLDDTPTGDSLLDPALADIAASEEPRNIRFWLEHINKGADGIRETALDRLVDAGILEQEEGRFLWVFRSRKYPMVDGKEEREIKLRLMGVLFSDEIPGPRDIMIICLAEACGIFKALLSSQELTRAAPRIEQVRKLDLIGQTTSQAIRDIELCIATATQAQGHIY